jgi:hypothetical protein
VGFLAEIVIVLITLGFAYAFTSPCTVEYTPDLHSGSPRDEACGGAFVLAAAYGGTLIVPIALAYVLWRRRTAWIVAGAVLAALAWPLVGIKVVSSFSPTT